MPRVSGVPRVSSNANELDRRSLQDILHEVVETLAPLDRTPCSPGERQAAEWLAEGLPADLPCAVVSRAAQPDQQIAHTTLGELDAISLVAAPSILIAGWAVRELSEANDAKSAQALEGACRLKA